MLGKNNEDLFSVAAYRLSSTDPTPVLFAMVADGIGGHQAGEVASEIAVEMISQAIAESDASQPTAIMQAAIIRASQTILAQSQADPKKKGMGTTCICTWLIDDRLYIASVGNSRLYLLREGKLHQVNVDHTWVQEAIEAGALTPEQARVHPNANIIRRYIGSRRALEVDLRMRMQPDDDIEQSEKNQGTRMLPGDRLLLCSDGLNDMVEDEVIRETLDSNDLEPAVDKLIALANENGGKDNITVIVLEIPGVPKKQVPQEVEETKMRIRPGCVGFITLGIVSAVAAAVFGLNLILTRPTPTQTPDTTSAPQVEVTNTALPVEADTEVPVDAPTNSAEVTFPASNTHTYTPLAEDTITAIPTNTHTPKSTLGTEQTPRTKETEGTGGITLTPFPGITSSIPTITIELTKPSP
jgi:protein phosphatase